MRHKLKKQNKNGLSEKRIVTQLKSIARYSLDDTQ